MSRLTITYCLVGQAIAELHYTKMARPLYDSTMHNMSPTEEGLGWSIVGMGHAVHIPFRLHSVDGRGMWVSDPNLSYSMP